ncbi:MAG: RecX family transcriptional regulator [Clostridia bacterium]|nr:RecX family transcriptional regulator [Clostridia bacterium]
MTSRSEGAGGQAGDESDRMSSDEAGGRAGAEAETIRRDLMRRALDLLSRRAYSHAELARRLADAGGPERRRRRAPSSRAGARPGREGSALPEPASGAEVAAVLAELERLGLLDDAAYARALLAARLRSGPEPRARLVARLRARGIAAETAQAAVDETLAAADPLELARAALARAWPRYARLPREEAVRRAGRFLLRCGFDPETARRAVRERAGRAEEAP